MGVEGADDARTLGSRGGWVASFNEQQLRCAAGVSADGVAELVLETLWQK